CSTRACRSVSCASSSCRAPASTRTARTPELRTTRDSAAPPQAAPSRTSTARRCDMNTRGTTARLADRRGTNRPLPPRALAAVVAGMTSLAHVAPPATADAPIPDDTHEDTVPAGTDTPAAKDTEPLAEPVVSVPVGRLKGSTRFETAVAISRSQFPGGAGTVYLARSDVFADAI